MSSSENVERFFQVHVVGQGPVFVITERTFESLADIENNSEAEKVVGIIYPTDTSIAGFHPADDMSELYTISEQLTAQQMLHVYDFLGAIPGIQRQVTWIAFSGDVLPSVDGNVISNIDFARRTIVGPAYQQGQLSVDEVEEIRASFAE